MKSKIIVALSALALVLSGITGVIQEKASAVTNDDGLNKCLLDKYSGIDKSDIKDLECENYNIVVFDGTGFNNLEKLNLKNNQITDWKLYNLPNANKLTKTDISPQYSNLQGYLTNTDVCIDSKIKTGELNLTNYTDAKLKADRIQASPNVASCNKLDLEYYRYASQGGLNYSTITDYEPLNSTYATQNKIPIGKYKMSDIIRPSYTVNYSEDTANNKLTINNVTANQNSKYAVCLNYSDGKCSDEYGNRLTPDNLAYRIGSEMQGLSVPNYDNTKVNKVFQQVKLNTSSDAINRILNKDDFYYTSTDIKAGQTSVTKNQSGSFTTIFNKSVNMPIFKSKVLITPKLLSLENIIGAKNFSPVLMSKTDKQNIEVSMTLFSSTDTIRSLYANYTNSKFTYCPSAISCNIDSGYTINIKPNNQNTKGVYRPILELSIKDLKTTYQTLTITLNSPVINTSNIRVSVDTAYTQKNTCYYYKNFIVGDWQSSYCMNWLKLTGNADGFEYETSNKQVSVDDAGNKTIYMSYQVSDDKTIKLPNIPENKWNNNPVKNIIQTTITPITEFEGQTIKGSPLNMNWTVNLANITKAERRILKAIKTYKKSIKVNITPDIESQFSAAHTPYTLTIERKNKKINKSIARYVNSYSVTYKNLRKKLKLKKNKKYSIKFSYNGKTIIKKIKIKK